jgi:hypothetical protein
MSEVTRFCRKWLKEKERENENFSDEDEEEEEVSEERTLESSEPLFEVRFVFFHSSLSSFSLSRVSYTVGEE